MRGRTGGRHRARSAGQVGEPRGPCRSGFSRDPNETLLHAERALSGKVHLRTTAGRKRLVFQPNGGNAGSNVTFTLCDGRGAGKATSLVLANDGRLRAGKPTETAAQACVQG
jgi:type IV fimbrial biogenesis protein FimT